ncbi:MAG: peptidoglycan bridge formation glycyltransferase FemA/FemB family protein [Paludibacteraceae bacterium]|nr:peptidoglycan bridge formation glycyltransferase FemA/FemB family protein [Paludibacteraceae bacterium]
MQSEIKILPITADLYPYFYEMVQLSLWGNPMLPMSYQSSLWGEVVVEDDILIGGWIGTIRGNIPVAKIITKSVYFDSYPVFSTVGMKNLYEDLLIRSMKLRAKREGITMFNLTHWGRDNTLCFDTKEKCATFTTMLHRTEEELWKEVESKQRNCVRKGEKSGVECIVCKGENSIRYLSDFQRLRQSTQQHAIRKNAKASMLLKSDEFFKRLFLDKNTTLFVGKVDDQVATVALMIQSGMTVYYYSGGSDYELNKKYSCSAYILWKAIYWFNNQGVGVFDMGGVPVLPSKEHPAYGVYAFKRSFGGEYREFDVGKIIINRWKCKLLDIILSQRKLLRLFSTKL